MAWPELSFRVYGYADPLVNTLVWQGCGFVIFLFGAGYAFASFDPARHYSVILMGAIAKLVGTTGVVYGYWTEVLLPQTLLWIFVNDVVWIVPFTMIVKDAIRLERPLRITPAKSVHDDSVWFDWMGT